MCDHGQRGWRGPQHMERAPARMSAAISPLPWERATYHLGRVALPPPRDPLHLRVSSAGVWSCFPWAAPPTSPLACFLPVSAAPGGFPTAPVTLYFMDPSLSFLRKL